MSYMKYQPRDRNPTSEILAEFAAIVADAARQREAERRMTYPSEDETNQGVAGLRSNFPTLQPPLSHG
jgi:hypothetical protein